MRKSVLVMTTAAILSCSGLQPVAAAASGPAVGKPQAFDLSAAHRKYRRHGGAFPLAAFGAIAGTIVGIAAAERRREYYEHPYGYGYAPGYLYEAPVAAPYGYGPPAYYYRGYGYSGGY